MLDGALLAESAIPKSLYSKVVSRMRTDSLTKAVRRDTSILKFGDSLLRKLGPKRANDIAQRMRQLALLGQQIAKLSAKKQAPQLDSFICGSKFEEVLKALSAECDSFDCLFV